MLVDDAIFEKTGCDDAVNVTDSIDVCVKKYLVEVDACPLEVGITKELPVNWRLEDCDVERMTVLDAENDMVDSELEAIDAIADDCEIAADPDGGANIPELAARETYADSEGLWKTVLIDAATGMLETND